MFSPYVGLDAPTADPKFHEVDVPAVIEAAHKTFVASRSQELIEENATACLATAAYYFPTRMGMAADKARNCGSVDALLDFDDLLHRGAELRAELEWQSREVAA